MKKSVRELRGKAFTVDGLSTEVIATIFEPEPAEDNEYQCAVRCAFLFDEQEKRIAGVDAAQAVDLAEMFLRHLLTHRGVEIIDA